MDFWRRWHITLSRFLRDYLYIPLGGSRKGPVRRYVNLFITMLLGGLWHGSDWTFVIWGGYHGVLLCVNHAWARLGVVLPALLARPLTLLAVVLGWVLFRSADFDVARNMLRAMANLGGSGATERAPGRAAWGVVLAFLVITQVAPTTTEFLTRQRRGWVVGLTVGAVFVVALLFLKDTLLGGARTTEFIYFQF